MASRTVKVVSGILVLLQITTSQCAPTHCPVTLAYAPELPSNGIFEVRSASPIAPTGVAVFSDRLVIEGPLVIDGELPFLGTVALEGILPSAGVGAVSHSCGGPVGIRSESVAPVSRSSGRSPLGLPGIGSKKLGVAPSRLGANVGLGGVGRRAVGRRIC